MLLLVDNYDSFSFNLYQMIGEVNADLRVVRNDELTVREIAALKPERIILSPGHGRPENAGNIMDIVRELGGTTPILGVCLGHQAICAAFGGTITYAKELMHGKQSNVNLDTNCPIFDRCPSVAVVGRYHSLALDPATLPSCLKVTGRTDDGEIMAVWHKKYPIFGVQFHPESILTANGKTMIANFVKGVNSL